MHERKKPQPSDRPELRHVLDAPSIRLSLVRLLLSRARFRFAGQLNLSSTSVV
jgi:hypothetical protein